VSCSCVGKKAFTDHYKQRAGNLPAAVKDEIFRLTHTVRRRVRECYFTGRRVRWTEKTTREDLARKFHMDRYLIDFVIAARCRFIRAAAKRGKYGWNLLSRTERAWFKFQEPRVRRNNQEEAEVAAVVSAFEALPLVERLVLMAEHRKAMARAPLPIAEFQALLADPSTVIEFGPFGVDEVVKRWSTR
jgi:hypothetical protein